MADYGLPFDVERRIEQDGISRQFPKLGDQIPIARIDFPSHGLKPGGTISVHDSRNASFSFLGGIERCDALADGSDRPLP
jgi:hypothetical protein